MKVLHLRAKRFSQQLHFSLAPEASYQFLGDFALSRQ